MELHCREGSMLGTLLGVDGPKGKEEVEKNQWLLQSYIQTLITDIEAVLNTHQLTYALDDIYNISILFSLSYPMCGCRIADI